MDKNEGSDSKRAAARANSQQFKERFQFILYVQDKTKETEEERAEHIVCQRYFNVAGFNYRSLESTELLDTMVTIVQMIQKDLQSKSRIYMWHNEDLPMQMTGFAGGERAFFAYPENTPPNKFLDKSRPEPYDVTFRFVLLVDENPVYQYLWDASDYPSYVRNNVDISNSDEAFRNVDITNMYFSMTLAYHMNSGKNNLVAEIIRLLCSVMSNKRGEDRREYCRKLPYPAANGESSLSMSLWNLNQKYIQKWERAVEKKTSEYFSHWTPSDREVARINRL